MDLKLYALADKETGKIRYEIIAKADGGTHYHPVIDVVTGKYLRGDDLRLALKAIKGLRGLIS